MKSPAGETYMDPITATIDKTEELLGHSPHPAIVMLPLGAWVVSNVCDAMGLATGDERYDDAARISMGIGLAGGAVAALTGVRDYDHIPADRHPNHEVATTHGLGNALVGTLMATSFVLRERDHQAGRRPGLAPRLLALAAGGLSLYTAWLGGKLVEEYGEAVRPVMEHEGDSHGRERLFPEAPLGRHQ
jgi:uncharacterized membrane protein